MTDFEKLLIFANAIGVPVRHEKLEHGDAGYFIYDGPKSRIEMDLKKKRDTEQTLILLHELGHAVDWIELGRPAANLVPSALVLDRSAADRFTVYQYEARAVKKMKEIHRLLGLKIPEKKLELERRFDLWIATRFLETAKYPTKLQKRSYRKELRRLLGSKLNKQSSK